MIMRVAARRPGSAGAIMIMTMMVEAITVAAVTALAMVAAVAVVARQPRLPLLLLVLVLRDNDRCILRCLIKRSREPNDDPLWRVILLPGFRDGLLFSAGEEEGIIVGMIFVSATPVDVGEVAAFVNNAYRGPSAEAGWASESKLMGGQRIDSAMLAETLANGKTTVLLMRDDEGAPLAGCVSVEPTDEPGVWYLSMLAVDPQRQADGLGRTLLAYAEDYVRARGARRVRITVIWLRHSLIEWYERRGYRRTGETEPFPYGDERFGVPSRDDLYFEFFEKTLAS